MCGIYKQKFISFKLAFLLNMKIVLFSLLCLILIVMTSYSYAQGTVPEKNTELPEAFLQIVVRDSNGILIAYIESEQIIGINFSLFYKFLDNQNQTRKEFFIKDDKKYESQQWEVKGDVYIQKLAYAATRLLDLYQNEIATLVQMRHDSYQTQPGDTIRQFWTVIRPAS